MDMKQTRILFDANPLAINKSGVGHFTEQIILALSRQLGPNTKLVGYYTAPRHIDLNKDYRHYSNLKFKKIGGVTARLLNVLRRINIQPPIDLLLKTKFDIALFTNYVSMPLFFGGHSCLFIYDLSFVDCPEFVAQKNRHYLKKWVTRRISGADSVLTISNFVKNRIIEEYDFAENKIFVAPIPPKPKPNTDNKIFKELGLSGRFLLFVGTIEPRKNIINLLLGYSKLPKALRDKYSLVLAGGDGWLDSEIQVTLRGLETKNIHVYKTGYISESKLAALYSKTTLVVQPSHYEGFGMPILEAMSYGKPVACSDIAVFREVSSGGAVFFDKDDPADIARNIEQILSSKERMTAVAASGLKTYSNYANWETVAARFTNFLQELGDYKL